MMASKKNVNQIEIEEGHNTSSFFWIEPATELNSYNEGEYGIDYAYKAKISIEEDYIADYMRYYLYKYFDSSLYHVCRNPVYGSPEFDWYDNWDVVSPIFKFSKDARKIIYTTNAIESLNSSY